MVHKIINVVTSSKIPAVTKQKGEVIYNSSLCSFVLLLSIFVYGVSGAMLNGGNASLLL